MIVTLVGLLILCLFGISFGKLAHKGYLSKARTDAIKGIFIILVFLTHIKTYFMGEGYVNHGIGDIIFKAFFDYAGQLIVVMFLFYSGYGVMEGIRTKGKVYVKSMPTHRILSTLLNFDVAVLIFGIVAVLFQKDINTKQVFLSLIAWDSLGNSNWYIFVILICYTVTWIFATILPDDRSLGWWVMFVLTVIMFILSYVKPPWWSNTILAFPAGILFSRYREKADLFFCKHYRSLLIVLIVLFVVLYVIPFQAKGLKPNLIGIVFALIIVMLSMRVKIDNGALRWCGSNLFPLYIYQRIPMIIFASVLPSWILTEQPILYVIICAATTILIAYLYRFIKISL